MKVSERDIQYLWDSRRIPPELTAVSGTRVRVMYPGVWNHDRGPDFRRAILMLGDRVVRGDVEIHLRDRDWSAHGHGTDAHFDGVVLQVVWEPVRAPTVDARGREIETVCLQSQVESEPVHEPADGVYCPAFAGIEPDFLGVWLEECGRRRLDEQANRLGAELNFSDFNQMLYEGIFEALGYSRNKQPMREIAARVPLSALPEWGVTRPGELLGLWLGAGTLFDRRPPAIPPVVWSKWLEGYSRRERRPSSITAGWNLFRVRPVNHPVIRLAQAEGLFRRTTTPMHDLLALLSAPEGGFRLSRFLARAQALFIPFEDDSLEIGPPGADRIALLAVNILFPMALVYARRMGYPGLEGQVRDALAVFPRLPGHHVDHEMRLRLTERQWKAADRTALRQQGLLHCHHRYCRHRRCTECRRALRTGLGLKPA